MGRPRKADYPALERERLAQGVNKALWAKRHNLNINTYRRATNGIKPQTVPARVKPIERVASIGIVAPSLLLDDLGEKLQEHNDRAQELKEQLDPVITHRTVEIDTDRPVPLLLSGCWQMGGRWTNHDFIRQKLGELLTVGNARVGLFGDEIDNFRSGSFAGARSVYDQGLMPPEQSRLFVSYLDAIKERVIFGMSSQHGAYWDEKLIGYAQLKTAYLQRDIPYFDGQAYVKIHVGRETYNLAVAHEFSGSSIYNPVHAQRRALWQNFPNADAVAMADRHQYALMEFYVYHNEVLAGNRHSPYVWLAQIGTAKGGADPYTIRSWSRGQMEWPWLVLWPDRHEIRGTRNLDDVIRWSEAPTKVVVKPGQRNGKARANLLKAVAA